VQAGNVTPSPLLRTPPLGNIDVFSKPGPQPGITSLEGPSGQPAQSPQYPTAANRNRTLYRLLDFNDKSMEAGGNDAIDDNVSDYDQSASGESDEVESQGNDVSNLCIEIDT
jgi:hypothetical protein